jgi:hypothetical protein
VSSRGSSPASSAEGAVGKAHSDHTHTHSHVTEGVNLITRTGLGGGGGEAVSVGSIRSQELWGSHLRSLVRRFSETSWKGGGRGGPPAVSIHGLTSGGCRGRALCRVVNKVSEEVNWARPGWRCGRLNWT